MGAREAGDKPIGPGYRAPSRRFVPDRGEARNWAVARNLAWVGTGKRRQPKFGVFSGPRDVGGLEDADAADERRGWNRGDEGGRDAYRGGLRTVASGAARKTECRPEGKEGPEVGRE